MTLRPFCSFAALVLAAAACAPAVDWSKDLARLKNVGTDDPARRSLADLDVTGDQRLDAGDATALQALADQAQAELKKRGKSTAVAAGLYHGPKEKAAPALTAAVVKDGALYLGALADDDLTVVAIEARWRALQVRMAALDGPTDAKPEAFGGVLLPLFPAALHDKVEPADICKAVEGVRLEKLKGAGLAPVAVFDFDSTVVDGNIMDPFLAVLIERKLIRDAANPKLQELLSKLSGIDRAAVANNSALKNATLLLSLWSDATLAEAAKPSAKDMFYLIVTMLAGVSTAEGAAAAAATFTTGALRFAAYRTQIYDDHDGCGMRRVVRLLNERGIEPHLLSATFDLLAVEAARQLGIPTDRAVGSVLEVKDGHYTGEVKDSAYYTKGAIVRQWLEAPPLFAFGDSARSDFSMLAEAAGLGFMIHGRPDFVARSKEEAGGRLVAVEFDGTEASLFAEGRP